MQSADPCVVCGGNALKLIDGYYYCVECGTQNTNVRETVVEQKTLGDGTFALATRRKIVKLHDSKIQMSGEWYKWHAYNFVILGLADELVAAGAKPTFKLKLLWIWTRYIKKYQNKDELGFEQRPEEAGNNDNITLPSFMVEQHGNDALDEEDNEPENEQERNKNINKNVILDGSKRDIKFLSKGVIIAMLYLALNLDESDIQLYHLLRFIKEKRLNFSNIQRFLPDDINVKSIQDQWLKFIHSKVCNIHRIRALGMSLLRKLDLGTPKVPDMRKIVDDFLLELCLPNDIKPMIYSLMFFHRCDFLDMSNKSKEHLVQMPDYEGVAMTYVLVALKMCFGLDGDYEERISDAVEKINDERNLSKSYRTGKYSEPSNRLFSFREWLSYVQFRKITLCKSCLHMAEQHYLDTDDNVYIEHMSDRPQDNKDLQDETAMNLINKIPLEDEGRVIPKTMFSPTLTPMTDYTEIIIDHNQDQEIRELLSEDFTRYSLNYACEYLELVDANSENIIKGVSEDRKTFSKVILGTIVTKKSNKKMVYVKNCENRNWMITNPPKKEHVTCEGEQNVSNDKESDHGYDSENPVNEKDVSKETENADDTKQSINEVTKLVNDSENLANKKEVSKVTKNVDDTDQSMNEDSRGVNDSKNPVYEKGHLEDTDLSMTKNRKGGNDSENLVNEKGVSISKEIIDDTDKSLNKDSVDANDYNYQVNEKGVCIENIDNTDQSMTEDDKSANNLEHGPNEKEVSEVNKNVDQSMTEDSENDNDSENPVYEKGVYIGNENMVDTDQYMIKNSRHAYGYGNPEKEKKKSLGNENIDETDESMTEDGKSANNSEHEPNEKEVSEVNENVDEIDQNINKGEVSDSENPANEKKATENIKEITDQGITDDKRVFIIPEDDNDKNIFDDDFAELDLKDEMELNTGEDFYANNEDQPNLELPNNESMYDDRASISDVTDDETVFPTFNPDTFNREETIKELILNACKKYKIPIPRDYKPPKEPRKRKADVLGNEETPREPRKRAKVNRFEVKQKVDELISGYYNLKQADLISQVQEAVSLAIERSQFDSVLNVSNVNQNEVASLTAEQASDGLTRTNSIVTENLENQSNVTLNQSTANPQISQLDQTATEQNLDKTVKEDEIIDESWESKLFEGEEEMKIDDLVPKGDPKFDEEKYDVNQLYIKIKVENEDVFQDVPPNLEEIINKKIELCKHSTEFKKLKAQHIEPVKTKYESDSEDDIPLHDLQEEKNLIADKIAWEDNFEPLINEANVSEFKYWFRHYDEDFMTRSLDWHKKFDEELKENTPSSFYFVIRECAAILNCSTFTLYKHMQALEKYIIARAKHPD